MDRMNNQLNMYKNGIEIGSKNSAYQNTTTQERFIQLFGIGGSNNSFSSRSSDREYAFVGLSRKIGKEKQFLYNHLIRKFQKKILDRSI